MEEIFLNKVTYEFLQEGNTDGTTSPEEKITVEIQSSLESLDKSSGYFVIRTDGWSFDNIKEFKTLLKSIENVKIRF